jgi:hypothetical protein
LADRSALVPRKPLAPLRRASKTFVDLERGEDEYVTLARSSSAVIRTKARVAHSTRNDVDRSTG